MAKELTDFQNHLVEMISHHSMTRDTVRVVSIAPFPAKKDELVEVVTELDKALRKRIEEDGPQVGIAIEEEHKSAEPPKRRCGQACCRQTGG
eukprot:GABV01013885.1.p1 GENE.GABV01013885.1~~GABV01013885.1.p1  ORF type:complete len:103 (+),score=38.51 GABV01013885.1:35-310(+)